MQPQESTGSKAVIATTSDQFKGIGLDLSRRRKANGELGFFDAERRSVTKKA